jgi:hypothetical protein
MSMSPFELKVCLHYFVTGTEDWTHESSGEPLSPNAAQSFINKGLLQLSRREGVLYSSTEMLDIYVRALLAVQLPVKVWTVPSSPDQHIPDKCAT